MSPNPEILSKMKDLLIKNGGPAQKNARQEIIEKFSDSSKFSQALRYFSNGALKRSLPVFPALVSISCEAACGNKEKAVGFGESIVMITGAADLHDDVIDQSILKGPYKTVFGKFGSDITILAGDVLLVCGITKLYDKAAFLDKKRRDEIINLFSSSVFEISRAETAEYKIRAKGFDIKPIDYQKILQRKATVPELAMRIGAIIGNGNLETVNSLSHLGRTYGYITSVVDEFVDVLDYGELANRLRNECPPLPIIYLLQELKDAKSKTIFLQNDFSIEENHQKLINAVKNSTSTKEIRKNLASSISIEMREMKKIATGKILEEIETLLLAPLFYLADLYSLEPTGCSN